MPRRLALTSFALFLTLTLTGCFKDLLPVPNPPHAPTLTGFCRKDGQGRLIVTIKNRGLEPAPGSTTTVVFEPVGAFQGQTVDVPTPAIPAGATVELLVPFPAGCAGPCNFTITADSEQRIAEHNDFSRRNFENNNTVEGSCP